MGFYGWLALLPWLAGSTEGQELRALGKPIALGAMSLTAERADAKDWLARHPYELTGVKGTLRAFTLRFQAKEITGVSFLMHETDPARSDISYSCGAQSLNPFRAATLEEPGKPRFGSLGTRRAADGRNLGGFVGKGFSLALFFDVPEACAADAQSLRFVLKVDGTQHVVGVATPK